MTKAKSRPAILAAVIALSLAPLVIGAAAATDNAALSDNWVRWLPGDLAMAGYFTFQNDTDHVRRLTGVAAPDFKMAMLHKSVEKNGQARMVHVDAIKLAPGEKVTFKPGSYHVMLMHRKHAIKRGDRLPITLKFADGSKVKAMFPVKGPTGQ